MNNYTFSITMRDKEYNLISQGRLVILSESADAARTELLAAWDKNWPDPKVHDIELHEVATITRDASNEPRIFTS